MKKLIEELDAAIEEDAFLDFYDAIEIVKSHDPWIDVNELPPLDAIDICDRPFSIRVLVRGHYKNRITGFCYLNSGEWYDNDGNAIHGVTNWAYLPEVQP